MAGSEIIDTWDGSQRRYFLKDHLGSVRSTVDQNGAVDGYDDYYPFGLTMPGRSSNSSNPNDDYKFTGYEKDDEAGLDVYFANARMYDPVINRFWQIDPRYELYPSWTTYQYGLNNPLKYTDPTGECIKELLPCPEILQKVGDFLENHTITLDVNFTVSGGAQIAGESKRLLGGFTANLGSVDMFGGSFSTEISSDGIEVNDFELEDSGNPEYTVRQSASITTPIAGIGGELSHEFDVDMTQSNPITRQETSLGIGAAGHTVTQTNDLKTGESRITHSAGSGFEVALGIGIRGFVGITIEKND